MKVTMGIIDKFGCVGMLRFALLYFIFYILYRIYDTCKIKGTTLNGRHENQLFLDVTHNLFSRKKF